VAWQLFIENVGSLTTVVVEMLKETNAQVNDAEATLLAIGIHADTGTSPHVYLWWGVAVYYGSAMSSIVILLVFLRSLVVSPFMI